METCNVSVCDRIAKHKGLCHAHYERERQGIPLDSPIAVRATRPAECIYLSCERPANGSLGYCITHYQRQRHGKNMDTPHNAQPGRDRTCEYRECNNPHLAGGLCSLHYSRVQNGSDMDAPKKQSGRICSVTGCDNPHTAVGYCGTHASRHYSGRDINTPIQSYNLPLWTKRDAGEGYLLIKTGQHRKDWVKEHRYVMEQHIGRALYPKENVHHINGDRKDNRIENLELWSTSQPKGQRVADKLAWAHEFIAQYEGTQLSLELA